jgi:polysaccharide biosynthesis transport protein
MRIIDIIRLLRKHVVLLAVIPVLLASLVVFMTRKPHYVFTSQTTLYTGLATGLTVEMDKTFNFAATNAAFDNLMNIIKSRETMQEVSIRLLSQHLMLEKPDPKFISYNSFSELKSITPAYIYKLIEKSDTTSDQHDPSNIFPASLNRAAFEQTVKNLTELMNSSDTNFVYRLFNNIHPHYSFSALSSVKVQRMFSSDLLKLDFQSDDPGICQQTLAMINTVCIKNYKLIKENRSDAVVKYFENQLKKASVKLNNAEDKLLQFNMDNNIINYYEQSKAVAMVKEELDKSYNTKKVEIAGLEASIKRLEEKLDVQQQIQLKSSVLVEKKNLLGELSYQIASAESKETITDKTIQQLTDLKYKSELLKEEIRKEVNDLYAYGNSVEGIPLNDLLSDWLNKVIAAEDAKASLKVMADNYKEFLKQYGIYAPAGANLKRIEREISVSENEFLEILHGLNLANLKLQDNEFSSNIKAVDPPYFPLSPIPTKRKVLVLAAFMVGFMMVLTTILAMEYLDNTLKNPAKATRLLNLPFLGVIPKILLKPQTSNLSFVINRMQEFAVQNIERRLKTGDFKKTTLSLLIFSTMKMEGKTVVATGISAKLCKMGKNVLYLNYYGSSLNRFDSDYENRTDDRVDNENGNRKKHRPFPLLKRLLGYPDPRIDYNSPFLDSPENTLDNGHYLRFNISDSFYESKSYTEILEQNNLKVPFNPDYVIIEIPPLLHYPYPTGLFSNIDLPILVCRSNRNWSDADQTLTDAVMQISGQKINFILNGVELVAVESIMGELPKERSRFRQKMKNVFRFQFFSQNHI